MRKKLIGISALVLVLALLLTLVPSCGKKEEAEVKTLKVGILLALSGPFAPYGVPVETGAKWAVDLINEGGGIRVGKDRYMIETISYDDKMSGSVAADMATKMVYDDKLHYAFGPIDGPVLGSRPILQEGKCIEVYFDFSIFPSVEWPYTINLLPTDELYHDAFVGNIAKHHPELKTMAFLDLTRPGAEELTDLMADIASRHGMTLVAHDLYQPGTTDFYPYLTKIIAKSPDFINFSTAASGYLYLMVKQARELGYTGVLCGPGDHPDMIEQLGPEAEGFMDITANWTSPLYTDETRALYQDFSRRYPEQKDYFSLTLQGQGYKAIMLLADAIEEAGSIDPDAVLAVLDDPDFRFDLFGEEAMLGGFETFGIRRVVEYLMPLSEVINGEVVTLEVTRIVVP